MTLLIEAHRISKHYRSTVALADVTFNIPAGAVYALVGANGAGKTTLIKLLLNIFPPSAGRATVLGVSSTLVAGEVFERIGYVSENQEVPESMSVGAFLAYVRDFYPSWDNALEAKLVRQFDLPLDRKLKNLSRGMRMKVGLASVLAYRPSLIILDEPFSGLDPFVRDELVESLLERGPETAVFLSSHDLFEIESLATHVGYLEKGRLLFSEEMSTLADRFRSIEITFAPAPSDSANPLSIPMPTRLPATWLHPQLTGDVLRFVDSQFSADSSAELAQRFPEASGIAIAPMTLRSIFVSIAKAGRASRAADLGAD
jgi:ABC-2 type transport system ATP-binding protein